MITLANMKPILSETPWLATIWFFTCHKYSMCVKIIHASVRGFHVLDNFLYLFFKKIYLAFKLRGAKYSYIVEKTKGSSRPSHYFYIIKKTYILLISRPYSPHFLPRATRSWLKYIKAWPVVLLRKIYLPTPEFTSNSIFFLLEIFLQMAHWDWIGPRDIVTFETKSLWLGKLTLLQYPNWRTDLV